MNEITLKINYDERQHNPVNILDRLFKGQFDNKLTFEVVESSKVAFPQPKGDTQFQAHYETGLSKREYVASLAMAAIIQNPNVNVLPPSGVAKNAVEYADALLKELK